MHFWKTLAAAAIAVFSVIPAQADDIAGVYKGMIYSGGDHPGTTIITVSDNGVIGATYVYSTGAGVSAGELTACSLDAHILRCTWVDEYGEGDFMAEFQPDRRRFIGAWFDGKAKGARTGLEGGYPWTGKRAE